MQPRTILFATDFSLGEKEALHTACQFARAWKAKILIAHVDDSDDAKIRSDISPRLTSSHRLQSLVPADPDIEYEYVLRTGDAAKVIREIEKEFDADLIVLGTQGRKGLQRVFLGSVAESVIRSADCPVMTLRQVMRAEKSQPKDEKTKVLVPTDFSIHSYAALDFASSLALSTNAGLTILYVDESPESGNANFPHDRPEWREQRDELWQKLQKVKPTESGVPFGHKILNGPAARNITEYGNQNDYDYVVLGTHGRTGVGRVLLGSVAEKVVRSAECAVITVKPSNKRHMAADT